MLVAGVAVPVVLAALVLGQTAWFAATTCETYDEYTYLRMGICVYRDHDWKSLASPMCPALPIVLEYWLPALRTPFLPGSAEWDDQVPDLTRQARFLTASTLGVPLVWLVYGWLARRRNWVVGAIGGGLLALSPTFLAAASVATTDACFACFGVVATGLIHWYQVRPSRGTFVAMGGGIGLAIAAKQSGAIFFAVALIEVLLRLPRRQPGWTGVDYGLRLALWIGNRLGLLVVVAGLTDWACYGFHFAPPFGAAGVYSSIPVIVPMVLALFPNGEQVMEAIRHCGPPLALDTFVGQMEHARQGHGAFLMGMHGSKGWWYFFPVALGIKSTPVELALMAVTLGLACRPSTWRDPARRVWLASALIMLGAGMVSSINIGQRYMLLIYPLVILAAVDWLGQTLARWPGRGLALGVSLLAWQASSVAGVMPHYLAYFNSAIGGPAQGYRYLVDSSLDWGQDIPTLKRLLDERNYHSVAFCYFGTGQVRTYNLRTIDWLTPDEPTAAACDWLAISATSLMGAYGASSPLYERLRDLPSTQAGYSIFLWDLRDPRVRAVWNELRHRANPLPVAAEPPIRER